MQSHTEQLLRTSWQSELQDIFQTIQFLLTENSSVCTEAKGQWDVDLGDKRPVPWRGVSMAMISIASPHFCVPASLQESTGHICSPENGARGCLHKQRGMSRSDLHTQGSGWPAQQGKRGHSGSEVMADLFCEKCSLASAFIPLI